MDNLQAPISTNGNDLAPASIPVCALAELPQSVHNYIHGLEQRVIHLEAEQKRFMDALVFAGKMLFENPSFKMISMALPKEMKTKLQEFFKGVQT